MTGSACRALPIAEPGALNQRDTELGRSYARVQAAKTTLLPPETQATSEKSAFQATFFQ
jgi:hypothetical protein